MTATQGLFRSKDDSIGERLYLLYIEPGGGSHPQNPPFAWRPKKHG